LFTTKNAPNVITYVVPPIENVRKQKIARLRLTC